MIRAYGILIEEHRVWFLVDIILVVFFLLFLLSKESFFINHLFIFQVDIEQDLPFIVFQQICVGSATFEDTEGIFERLLEEIIACLVGSAFLLLAEANLRSVISTTFFNEKSVANVLKYTAMVKTKASRKVISLPACC